MSMVALVCESVHVSMYCVYLGAVNTYAFVWIFLFFLMRHIYIYINLHSITEHRMQAC